MPKRKYTAAERQAMGLESKKNKSGGSKEKKAPVYDDEYKPRKGANFKEDPEGEALDFAALIGAGVIALLFASIIINQ